jgi:phage FluMu protein Com
MGKGNKLVNKKCSKCSALNAFLIKKILNL